MGALLLPSSRELGLTLHFRARCEAGRGCLLVTGPCTPPPIKVVVSVPSVSRMFFCCFQTHVPHFISELAMYTIFLLSYTTLGNPQERHLRVVTGGDILRFQGCPPTISVAVAKSGGAAARRACLAALAAALSLLGGLAASIASLFLGGAFEFFYRTKVFLGNYAKRPQSNGSTAYGDTFRDFD